MAFTRRLLFACKGKRFSINSWMKVQEFMERFGEELFKIEN